MSREPRAADRFFQTVPSAIDGRTLVVGAFVGLLGVVTPAASALPVAVAPIQDPAGDPPAGDPSMDEPSMDEPSSDEPASDEPSTPPAPPPPPPKPPPPPPMPPPPPRARARSGRRV
ncbi:MAG: hypothetical protein ACKORL_11445 [Phycisphaerales bacterium]